MAPNASLQDDVLSVRFYAQLRHLARTRISLNIKNLVSEDDLAHEAFLLIAAQGLPKYQNEKHLRYILTRAINDVLVELFRRRDSLKRGGAYDSVGLEETEVAANPTHTEFIDLKRALARLAREKPVHARVISLSFFQGMTHREIAATMDLSRATVERHWRTARGLLKAELQASADPFKAIRNAKKSTSPRIS